MQVSRPKKRSRKYAKMTDTGRHVVAHFLEGIKAIAATALQSCDAILAAAPHLPGAFPQVEYWKKIIQGIEWMESWLHRSLPFVEQMAMHLASGNLPQSARNLQWMELMGIVSTADEISKASAELGRLENMSQPTIEQPEQQRNGTQQRGSVC